MEKDFSLLTEEFRQSLIDLANTAGLPPAVIYYIFADVYSEIETTYRGYLKKARAEELKKKNEDNNLQPVPADMDEKK